MINTCRLRFLFQTRRDVALYSELGRIALQKPYVQIETGTLIAAR